MAQEDLIKVQARRVRCVAGPGTGKTWAMQRRVERLLADGVSGEAIFAVTFTRHAAAQLRGDLTTLEAEGADEIKASTLHSHAFSILQREDAIDALGRHPRPLFPYELTPFHHDISLDIGSVQQSKGQLKAFETMWARLQHEEPGWPEAPEDEQYEAAYLNWMRFHRTTTVGELVPLAIKYLRLNPANEAEGEFDHVIVDEYQDLNRADQELVEILAKAVNLVVIGDDDQSIYSFRHANPEGIQEWLDAQEDPKADVNIRTCRRCGGKIISLANALISQNEGRIETELSPLPGREQDGVVDLVQWNTRNRETEGIAKGVAELQSNLSSEQDILVLVPRHEYARYLGEELEGLDVDSFKIHTRPDWNNTDLGEALSLLALVEDPDDLAALRYWLGLGADDWRRDDYRRIMEHCRTEGLEIQNALADETLMVDLGCMPLRARWDALEERLKALGDFSNGELLDELLPLEGSTEELGRLVREHLERTREEAGQDTEGESGDEPQLSGIVRKAIIDPAEEDMDPNINIMTYWGAKGLTAHTVVVTSLVNGILPGTPTPSTPDEQRQLDEDRRLLYVSITRPKEHLIISSFRKVQKGEAQRFQIKARGSGYYPRTEASRFLGELGPDTPQAQKGETWLTTIGSAE